MSHSAVCEWSKAPNARCRCQCKGTQHGIAEVRARLLADKALARVRAQLGMEERPKEVSNDQ